MSGVVSVSMAVCVCVDGDAPALDDVLAALRGQGAEPEVVRDPVIAIARNSALAACRCDVLAYVDDDVVVDDGWWELLRAAWAAADADVGAIGGPISGARATVDYGKEPLDLDAAHRTLHAGNLSFRRTALAGVQGFWPARGHPGTRDWFSEEHLAQRELAAAGWRIRYEPALAAHRAGPPDRLTTRARYGARLQLLGAGRPRGEAASAGLRAAAGALAALARGDRAGAAERARRAAENAGALLGPRLARRDVEPAAASTPLRHSVPVPPRRLPRPGVRAAILAYHRVGAGPDPLGLAVDPSRFAEHLDLVRRSAVPLALDEFADLLCAGDLPERAVAVTFDDAYAGVIEHAAPALVQREIPATLFVPTGHVARRRGFWWDEVGLLLAAASSDAAPVLELECSGERRAWAARTPDQRDAARRHLHAWLQPKAPAAIAPVLEQLRVWAGVDASPPVPAGPDAVARFAAEPGMTLGAHTVHHVNLRTADEATRRAEIEGSRDDLREWTGTAPRSFAYPFGVPRVDFDAATERIVAESGFAEAVAMTPGPLRPRCDRYALPRHMAPDVGGADFAAWLDGVLG
jgi:peptidoglycan/xylan/chitin deacetylase (PgdA/CDA1 family)